VTTLVGSGLCYPQGVAVDGAGNVYIADTYNDAIKEVPRAFVDPTARMETAAAGSDALQVVLPATANLTGTFAPASSQCRLTISGVANGVVSFAFTATTTNRTAHITLLGQTIAVTQSAPITPPVFGACSVSASGQFRLCGTGTPNLTYTLQASCNLVDWVDYASLSADTNGLIAWKTWTPMHPPASTGCVGRESQLMVKS
jgi:DNA-binding beta-propeller fold protein YncE